MVKRKKAGEKEMGGAEKLRKKKLKQLEQDAAKCAKLPDFFQGGRRAKEDAASETGPSTAHDTTSTMTTGGHGGKLTQSTFKMAKY